MTLGLDKTIKNCLTEQARTLIRTLGIGVLYILFMTMMLREEGDAINETLATSIGFFLYVFTAYSMIYHMNFLRTSAAVMLMLGDTRKNISIGRHIPTVIFIVAGALITLIQGKIGNEVSIVRNMIMSAISVVMVSGVGMLSGFFTEKFGQKYQWITTVVVLFVVGVSAGVFFGMGAISISINKAFLCIFASVAAIIYVVGTVTSHIYIKTMEVRP